MRISTNYIYDNTRRAIQDGETNLLHTQEIMATQKKVNHLSDDPVAVGRILNTSAMTAMQDTYTTNLANGTTYQQLYDSSLESTTSLLSRAKELLVGEANSATSTPATREASRVELVSLASQLVSIGNLQYSDRFLYAGYADGTAPFLDIHSVTTPAPTNTGGAAVQTQSITDPALVTGDAYSINFTAPGTYDVVDTTTGAPIITGATYTSGSEIRFDGISVTLANTPTAPAAGDAFAVTTVPAGTYVGDSGTVKLEMEPGVTQTVNVTGDQVFQGAGLPGGVNLFDILQQANTALRTNNQPQIQALLTQLDKAMSQITSQQSIIGARQNLFQDSTSRVADVQTNLKMLLSNLSDADATQTVTDLNRQDNAFQALLTATSKVIQPSLLDYLQ